MSKNDKDPTPVKGIRSKSRFEWLDVCSFLLFLSMNLFAVALFTNIYWFFLLLILVDGLATLYGMNLVVSLERSAFAFLLVLLSATVLSFNVVYLVLEMLSLVALLDFSFLLRRLSDTKFESIILKRRLSSYVDTLLPSFFLSYAVLYLYSFIPTSQSFADPIFAISSVGAIFVILVVVRSLSPTFFGRKQAGKSS